MIYLGNGKSVNTEFWEFLKTRGDYIFLRETAELICTKQKLVNRCIKPSKVSINIRNRSPRKVITPRKYFLVRELFKDYMEERKYNDAKKRELISKFNRQLGYKIKDLRRSLNYEEDEE
ncbi:BEN domain-containing protein 5-like [Nasonia vitripennis]|uniref:Uncharacterized protein n=1 Tax=Nasonia vitripennis TaxID=7425 RepID=A0A7M7T631_NASVI|nr:BEN domain-containing protein 5-like [Nasonia vitripennis]